MIALRDICSILALVSILTQIHKTMTINRLLPYFAVGMFAVQSTAHAATTVYTNYAGFIAALTSFSVESFDSIPKLSSLTNPYSLTTGPYSYSVTAPGGLYSAGNLSDAWMSTNVTTDPIIFSFPSADIYAVGGYFFDSDVSGAFQAGNITIQTNDLTSQTVTGATTTSFVGFISSNPITTMSVTADQTGGSIWPTANDLVLGVPAAASPVPEPASAMVNLILGGTGIGLTLRRRRR